MDPKALRRARKLRAKAEAAVDAAKAAEAKVGIDEAYRHAWRTAKNSKPEDAAHAAIIAAYLTPGSAAAICGISRDVLKKAWGRGRQFRPARPEWKRALAPYGVPRSAWRTEP